MTVPLISCPACGKQISSQAATCPNCGQPVKPSDIAKSVADGNRKAEQQKIVGGCLMLPCALVGFTVNHYFGPVVGFAAFVVSAVIAAKLSERL